MAAVENQLLATSKIPANTGHNLHKGTPRETFIKQFLQDHLSERVAIGTGEIIDANSKPNEPRNQIDIVIYERDYPRLSFGGGINGFLSESVVATIEVKSILTKEDLIVASKSAKKVKGLQRNIVTVFSTGIQPPSILSYVVAYDGPASMKTIAGWMPDIKQEVGIEEPRIPISMEERRQCSSSALDGIFVLGKGLLHFGNAPVGFFNYDNLTQNPELRWAGANLESGSLLTLFLMLTMAVSNVSGSWLNPMPYAAKFQANDTWMN